MTRDGKSGGRLPRTAQAGYSLIEVMAALVILGLAMTAVFATFTTQQRSFTAQARVTEMQYNLRIAVDYISRDLRMAGYGLPGNVAVPGGATPAGFTTVRALFAVDNTTGPDQIYVLYRYDMDANQPPDNVAVAMTGTGSVTVDSGAGFLSTGGELVLITDETTADMFQTTSVAGNVLSFGGLYGTIAHTLYGLGPPPAVVAKARFVRYFIDSTTDAAHPTLMVDRNIQGLPPQPVADDVEDLQLAYGLDTDNNVATPLSWVSAPTAAQFPQVRQIRLMLMARPSRPDRNWSETRPALGNHAGAGVADGYRRRVSDIVVDLRNSEAGL